ncbi:MAG TPA: hypothetical protein ENG60_03355 [Thermoplasmatales archaeon]|nr:hypothetical protein [Thermoplasmatales archaeon]HEX17428.1 hypothetical protein [Thermoplasmatales archaeon]
MGSSRSRIVILDTSVLMSIFEKRFDLIEDIELEVGRAKVVVPESVLKELEKLASSRGSRSRKAKAVLDLIESKGFETVRSIDWDVDNDVILLAKNLKGIVVTLDKDLIKRLKEESVEVMTWKNKRFRLI